MEIKENLTVRNFKKGNGKQNKYIVIHYVGAVSSASANASYFKSVYRGASAHYFVDEKEIYRVVADKDIAWHCGATSYKHAYCRNTNSIGIEMCCYKKDGKLEISDKVVERTIELTKSLMSRYGIPASNVIRHYDVTGKSCPAPFVTNVSRWNEFKNRLRTTTTSTAIKIEKGCDEKVYVYKNGSTSEIVYSDSNCTIKLGSLDPKESCDCLGTFNGKAMVRYRVGNTNNYKIGFVKYLGGIQK